MSTSNFGTAKDFDRPSESPASELEIRGNIRVLCEIRQLLENYGDSDFSASSSMLVHWANLIEADLNDDLRARLPELKAALARIEAAKKVSVKTLQSAVEI